MFFDMVPSVLLSMVALIANYFKESDWLLKNLLKSESGWKSYHGEKNWGYHVKEHKKLYQKPVSKVTQCFVWGQLSRKQTVGGWWDIHFFLQNERQYLGKRQWHDDANLFRCVTQKKWTTEEEMAEMASLRCNLHCYIFLEVGEKWYISYEMLHPR